MKVEIIAHTKSSNPKIIVDALETIHIYVKEPASEGKANKAVIKALADYYNVSKTSVKLVSGIKSKKKLFEIDD